MCAMCIIGITIAAFYECTMVVDNIIAIDGVSSAWELQ